MYKLMTYALMFILVPAISTLAAADAPTGDVLIAKQSIALPWVVGIGIFVAAVIVGFKHSGRTHLD
jgi:hypothetical protein